VHLEVTKETVLQKLYITSHQSSLTFLD